MKKITFLLVALMATFSVFTATGQNLVVNGSFEGDAVGAEPASWTGGSKDAPLVSDTYAQDGTLSVSSVSFAGTQTRLEQLVPVVAGKTYTFSFYYTGVVDGAVKNFSYNGLGYSDGYMDDGQPAVPVVADGTWGMYSKTFVANLDTVKISLRLYSDAYIDNLSLVASASDTTVVDTTVATTTVANIAEFIAAANTTDLVTISGSVLVSYANEYSNEKGDYSSVYLTDASGAILMYGYTLTNLMAGDKLTGLQGMYAAYKGTHEIVNAVIPTAVASSAPSPMVMLPENMTVADQSKYVRLEELTVSSEVSGEYTNLYGNSVGGGKIMLYDKFKTGIAVEEGKSYDMEGIVVLFNDALELAYTSAIETGNGVVNTEVNSVFFDGATIINPNKVAINVYSITGQLVVSGNDNINMNDYNTGVYIVTTPQGVIKISK